MTKWIAEFDLEDGDTMPDHMDLEYKGVKIDFHCKPLNQKPIFWGDCEHCSKAYGTLGCCDTVSNEWVYSCKEGQREYLLNKVRAEIMKLQTYKTFVGESTVYVDREDVLAIIDKYRTESEGKE
jgi:hypothetical protein